MAEDDDDEAFGDFASASFQYNSQLNDAGGSLAGNEDDEWGDFVKSPQQSKSSEPSFTGNLEPDNVMSPHNKRTGALPLSIFGDDEKEEVVDFRDSNPGKISGIVGDSSSNLVPKDVSNSRNLSIADLYTRYSEIKPDNRSVSRSTGSVDSIKDEVCSISSQNGDRTAANELKTMGFSDTIGTSDYSQLTNKSGKDEFSFTPNVPPGLNENDNSFGSWMQEFSFNMEATPNVQKSVSDLDMNGQSQQFSGSATAIDDDGDNGWEFKDAFSDFGSEDNKVDLTVHEFPERSAYSFGTESGPKIPLDMFGTSNGSINYPATSTDSVGYVATSSGVSSMFQEVDFTGIQPTNGFISETTSYVEQNNIKGSSNHSNNDGSEELNEDFGEFTAASAEIGSKPEVDFMAHEVSERSAYSYMNGSSSNKSRLFETSNGSVDFFALPTPSDYFATSSGIPSAEVDFFGVEPSIATRNGVTSVANSVIEQDNIKGLANRSIDVGDAESDEDFGAFSAASAETGPKPEKCPPRIFILSVEEKDTKASYLKHAIPLTIFGDEQSENSGSLDVQDLFMHQSTDQRNSHTPTKIISVNDLISSLYSQAEQTSIINPVQQPANTQSSLSDAVSGSIIVNHDDHLDDDSWDFKDASQKRVDTEESLFSNEDASSKLKLNNYLDFYSRLKGELCLVAKCQLERLKQPQGSVAVPGEDVAAPPLDNKFQLVPEEVEQMHVFYEENNQQDHPSGEIDLNGLIQVLLEPQFQILELEYHLSKKLLLVEKDPRSVIELIRHTTTMLKILTIGTMDEQRAYISLWAEMISACLQELKHGALIWNQATEKHVRLQLLSEPQGRQFFWAIGEIYRVVVILGASAKLFKPWTLSNSVDSHAIYILLEECHAVWSSSGLEEALSTVSASDALDNTSLLESIKHILGLDELELQNYVFAENGSRCRLSILTEGIVPEYEDDNVGR
ncbi:hypothetical protein CASFOL_032807 [Castilleja foliolosa]|uniref:Synergin gamma C-terminal domain-containing protein n=1 Tax=Castilleja foliolosa TaxID=1961234 RepID=A0ABD3C2J8_9LAMI